MVNARALVPIVDLLPMSNISPLPVSMAHGLVYYVQPRSSMGDVMIRQVHAPKRGPATTTAVSKERRAT